MFREFKYLIADYKAVVTKSRVWAYWAWLDVLQRYRGSIFGPFWITISMGIFIVVLSVIYAKLFKQPLHEYIPFLTSGFIVWYFVSFTLTDAPHVFIQARDYILQNNLPYSLYVARLIWRNCITLGHNAIIYLIVMLVFHMAPGWSILFVIPGLLLIIINLFWVTYIIALAGARFRDVPPLVASLVQVVFFVSPITWMPKLLGSDSLIVKLNPVVYFLGSLTFIRTCASIIFMGFCKRYDVVRFYCM